METFRYPVRFKVMTLVSAVVFAVLAVLLIGWAELNGIRHLEVFALILVMLGLYVLTAHGLSVRLAGFREGSLALYRALEDAWRGAATTRG